MIVGSYTSAVIIVTASRVKFRMESNHTCKLYMKFSVITSYKNGDGVRVTEIV